MIIVLKSREEPDQRKPPNSSPPMASTTLCWIKARKAAHPVPGPIIIVGFFFGLVGN